ncbi:MAG: GNAT family N-acetyltransferase [Saprospiraceae bacterium]|nr:GNAT family N-acetyltransferase [Saprospiraceae bacterium]
MPTPLTIQRIESPDQLPACAQVLVDAYNSEPWNDAWTPEKALEKLQCFYQSPKFLGWMAYDEGDQLLGATVGNIEPYFSGDYFYLKEMFIAPKAQRQGVGSALFGAVKSHLDSEGIDMMILFTSNQGFPFDFWQRTGFQEMEGMRMLFFAAKE